MPQDAGRVTMRGMVFRWPNEIRSQDPDIDFSAYFVPGDVVSIRNAAQYAGTFSYRVPDDGLAKFRPENERRPTYGDIELVGDLRGSFEAGQVVTLSDATLEWYVSGDDISDYLTTSSVAGIYSILSVSFDALQNRTTIRLDVEHNSTAWKGILSSVSGYATGSPLMTRPSDELLFDLSGSYTVSTVTSNVLSLADPVASNPDWEVVRDDFGGQSAVLFPVITTTGERWVGWMTVESTRPITRLLATWCRSMGCTATMAGSSTAPASAFPSRSSRLTGRGSRWAICRSLVDRWWALRQPDRPERQRLMWRLILPPVG
ncbi:Uncharacterised protein [Bordetella trematum]|nr:Uncharacterised protein [Bordetella trematum]